MIASNTKIKMFEDSSTPVVLLGCFRYSGIGILRSLGRLGVPVYVIDHDRFSVGFSSRYCRGKYIWDLARASADDSLGFLTELARKIGRRAVLIPNSDAEALFVADHAQRLTQHFIFPQPGAELVHSLCSKKDMYFLARTHGVATPETKFPQSRHDVLQCIHAARFPILLKPILAQVPIFTQLYGRLPRPMILAHTRRQLLEMYEATDDPLNLMLQEFIPGGDDMTWTFNGYFDEDSICRIAFTGRKLRNFPPRFGAASLAVCERNYEVESTTIDFMRAIGYKGGVDIDYRYDSRDRRYKVIDINPRIGAMLRVGAGANGMDVARALYLDMTGQPIVPTAAPEGRRWIVEDHDLRSSFFYYRAGELTISQWLNSVRGVDEAAYFARDDLRPFVAMLMRNAKAAFKRAPGWKTFRREDSNVESMALKQSASGSNTTIAR